MKRAEPKTDWKLLLRFLTVVGVMAATFAGLIVLATLVTYSSGAGSFRLNPFFQPLGLIPGNSYGDGLARLGLALVIQPL